jgi:hypothetical protein
MISMIMSSGNDPESFVSKAVHLTSPIGQDLVSVHRRRDGNSHAAAGELTYYLRVKPDRRRVIAAYPPHLERRRRVMS